MIATVDHVALSAQVDGVSSISYAFFYYRIVAFFPTTAYMRTVVIYLLYLPNDALYLK
jgi:hypothetical protein